MAITTPPTADKVVGDPNHTPDSNVVYTALLEVIQALGLNIDTDIPALYDKEGINPSDVTALLQYLNDQYLRSVRGDITTYHVSGPLDVGQGQAKFRFPFPVTILGVSAAMGVAATGAAIQYNVRVNGGSSLTASPLEVADGAEVSSEITSFAVDTLSTGDYLVVEVVQVGSATVGEDLSVFIRYLPDPLPDPNA